MGVLILGILAILAVIFLPKETWKPPENMTQDEIMYFALMDEIVDQDLD